jgi:hypothetical protein
MTAILAALIPMVAPFILQLLQGLIAKAASGGLNAPPPPAALNAQTDPSITKQMIAGLSTSSLIGLALLLQGCAAPPTQGYFIGPDMPIRFIKPTPVPGSTYQIETQKAVIQNGVITKPAVWTVITLPSVLPAGMTGEMLSPSDTQPGE